MVVELSVEIWRGLIEDRRIAVGHDLHYNFSLMHSFSAIKHGDLLYMRLERTETHTTGTHTTGTQTAGLLSIIQRAIRHLSDNHYSK